MKPHVQHQPDQHRFVLSEDDDQAELTYRLRDHVLIVDHTGVPPHLQHRGLGGLLAEAAIAYATEHRLTIDPVCPFMAAYFEQHPEHAHLLDPGRQA